MELCCSCWKAGLQTVITVTDKRLAAEQGNSLSGVLIKECLQDGIDGKGDIPRVNLRKEGDPEPEL